MSRTDPARLALVALAALLIPAAAPAGEARGKASARTALEAGPSASFSVDMHVTGKDGQSAVMKRTVAAGHTRMDLKVEGRALSVIQLGDEKRTVYMLVPEQKMVMKQTLAAAEARAGSAGGAPAAEAQPRAPEGKLEALGQETLDGKQADKFRVTYGETGGFLWMDPATDLPLRMEADGSRVDFRNYQFGEQPAELFEPPAGWQVQDLDEMMARLPQGMGAGGMVGGMASGMAGGMMGSLGGGLGASLGSALGGPIGAMAGQFLGQKLGRAVGGKAAKTVTGQ